VPHPLQPYRIGWGIEPERDRPPHHQHPHQKDHRHRMFTALRNKSPPIPILGTLQKNIFKKWQIFSAQNHVLKSPQFTINPPQTHHEFTSKKHHIFANPLQKAHKIGENPSGRARQKKSQNQIRRR
jgi:hypothetical protein